MDIERTTIESVEYLGNFEDEYVYDLSIADADTVFFANDILVKNTDSIFFAIIPENILDIDPDTMTKEKHIEIADTLAKSVNGSFKDFYMKTFNVPSENTQIIKCGREICAQTTLFIKKKRYASLYFVDDKNIRYDKNGKNGKLKIMGLDIKRSDCPVWVQEKLEATLYYLLDKKSTDDEMVEFIRQWRKDFMIFEPWKMGTPKRVNKMTYYTEVHKTQRAGVTIPGHARASINWNNMKSNHGDMTSTTITDGMKTIVCKLKKNLLGIETIAYPIDQANHLPQWFKDLPFDNEMMITVSVDQKIENIFGLLGWDLSLTKQNDTFSKLFSFE